MHVHTRQQRARGNSLNERHPQQLPRYVSSHAGQLSLAIPLGLSYYKRKPWSKRVHVAMGTMHMGITSSEVSQHYAVTLHQWSRRCTAERYEN